ncbi:uncharacterized protein PFL1_00065 [Pseudozyma flocculosa PF-1]|uniref:Related to l-azetidine-2-carboxylic acid acetyltransferase n=1 Tax=Pseudozyma flocculosa TaxID=84751 RepID=A0A5C3EVV9_9BASI|nr:uncharacterized protein PFL1_00065 [Pseudozyma flocculosa PF-1]EPQ31866.1 hypothetical protein PFL1_00065 [Pseudozyma flocculosa PF-1]SPO35231.1 related to l-azetidine-2-carboxylic acid acetyltransferase [Pseudozyma flocculosa]
MAYGHVPRPAGSNAADLKPRLYALPQRARTEERAAVVCVPFSGDGAASQPEYEAAGGKLALQPPGALVELLADVFMAELERGVTYPQHGPLTLQEFRDYFLGYDLIVAFFLPASALRSAPIPTTGETVPLSHLTTSLSALDFRHALAGFYYIKPNYPGRSSHICNAGFVVPPWNRGLGLGGVLGQSFLHFGPRAGYRASVFNLVYENNVASVRIWQRLGFQTVGKIPKAGLLKRADGQGEEFVDAFVIYKDLVEQGGDDDRDAAGKKVEDGSTPAL